MKQDMASEFKRVMDGRQHDATVDWNVEGGDGKDGSGLMLSLVGGDLNKWKWWDIRRVDLEEWRLEDAQ